MTCRREHLGDLRLPFLATYVLSFVALAGGYMFSTLTTLGFIAMVGGTWGMASVARDMRSSALMGFAVLSSSFVWMLFFLSFV